MYIGVDLGSTNIKAAVYDGDLQRVALKSRSVRYIRENGFVEFDAGTYYLELTELLAELLEENGIRQVRQIALTGQAESLVVLDHRGEPLMNAISWMDERSAEECRILSRQFSPEVCEAVTGQPAVLPTWPATKILWLKRNRPEIHENAGCYMLLKDYIAYRLTGRKRADMSIATFSFYFNIYRKTYWKEMLDAIGIGEHQLPQLCEPCTVVGTLLPEAAARMGLNPGTTVNTGTLDHFSGMIGTGSLRPGDITLSMGTVMAMTAMTQEPAPRNTGIAMHYGFLPDTHVMIPVAESGGVSLEWFRRTCMPQADYAGIDEALNGRAPNDLLFLPYLVGTNAPEFDVGATGVFWGLRAEHDAVDMAGAVMEGVAFVLRKNCERIASCGAAPTAIVAIGGGAKSTVWCQMQADITGVPVLIPEEKEAACLGAAMIAAVSDGRFESYEEAAQVCVKIRCRLDPNPSEHLRRKYRRFCALYQSSLALNDIS